MCFRELTYNTSAPKDVDHHVRVTPVHEYAWIIEDGVIPRVVSSVLLLGALFALNKCTSCTWNLQGQGQSRDGLSLRKSLGICDIFGQPVSEAGLGLAGAVSSLCDVTKRRDCNESRCDRLLCRSRSYPPVWPCSSCFSKSSNTLNLF